MSGIVTALVLGLLGSLHCIGMCGPIALALPMRERTPWRFFSGALLYNSGRAFTYSLMGAVSGAAGCSVKWAGGQQALSIGAGIFILIVVITSAVGRKFHIPFVERIAIKWKSAIQPLFRKKGNLSVLSIGLLNGMLPCGLVYAALAAAAAQGSALNGAIFMLVFGFGTFPAMMALAAAGWKIPDGIREKLRRMVPVFVGLMAVLLVLRGMELGIPLVSPEKDKGAIICPYCDRHKN